MLVDHFIFIFLFSVIVHKFVYHYKNKEHTDRDCRTIEKKINRISLRGKFVLSFGIFVNLDKDFITFS